MAVWVFPLLLVIGASARQFADIAGCVDSQSPLVAFCGVALLLDDALKASSFDVTGSSSSTSQPTMLSAVVNGLLDETGSGEFVDTIGINQAITRIADAGWFREILKPDGDHYDLALSLSNDAGLVDFGGVAVESITIKRFDDIIAHVVLLQSGIDVPGAIDNHLEFDPVEIEISATGLFEGVDSVTVSVSVEGLMIDLGVDAQFNGTRFGDLPLAAFPANALSCLLSAFDKAEISSFRIEATKLPAPTVSTGNRGLDVSINAALALAWITQNVEGKLLDALPQLSGIIKNVLNEVLARPFACEKSAVDAAKPKAGAAVMRPMADGAPKQQHDVVDFNEARLLNFFSFIVGDLIGATGDLGLNRIIALASEFRGTPGEFLVDNDPLTGSLVELSVFISEELGTFELSLRDLVFTGLDDVVRNLAVLEATSPTNLVNEVAFDGAVGRSAISGGRIQHGPGAAPASLNVTVAILADKFFQGGAMDDEVVLSLTMEGAAKFGVNIMALVLEPSSSASPLREFRIKDLAKFPCLLSTLESAELSDVSLALLGSMREGGSLHALVVGADCIKCTSPGWLQIERVWKMDDSKCQVTELLRRGTAALEEALLGETLRDALFDAIATSSDDCAAAIEAEDNAAADPVGDGDRGGGGGGVQLGLGSRDSELADMLIWGLVVAPVAVTILTCGLLLVRGRYRRRKRTQDRHTTEDSLLGDVALGKYDGTSIINSVAVPLYGKVLVLVGVAVAVALFVSAHAGLGAGVHLVLGLFGRKSKELDVAGFDLKGSIEDMWEAGVYPLALMIAVWSGAWPYAKQALLIFAMVAPPDVLSLERRGTLIRLLDNLSKWCLIDIYLLMMMMVAFRFYLPITDESFENASYVIPPDFIVVDVTVVAEWGFFGFVLAAILSLVCSHVAIVMHLNAMTFDVQRQKDTNALGSADGLTYEDVMDKAMLSPHGTTLVIRRETGIIPAGGKSDQTDLDPKLHTGAPLVNDASPIVPCDTDAASRARSFTGAIPPALAATRESLCRHQYSKRENTCSREESPSATERSGFGLLARVAIGACLLGTMALVFLGGYLPSFTFVFNGLAGAAIEILVPGDKERSYSLIELCFELGGQLDADDDLVTKTKYGTLQVAYMLFAFVVPLTQIALLFVLWVTPLTLYELKVLYIASDFAAAWGALEVFIVCIIAAILEISQFARYVIGAAIPNNEDGTFFDVQTELNDGAWVLLAAAVMLVVTNEFISSLARRSIQDRESDVLKMQVRYVDHGP